MPAALTDMLADADPDTLALVAVLAAQDGPESLAVFMAARGGDGAQEFAESRVPPRPGLVWKDSTHRWISPDTGEDYEDPSDSSDSAKPLPNIAAMKSRGEVVDYIKGVKTAHQQALRQKKADALADIVSRIEKGSGIPAKKLRSAVKATIEDFGSHQLGTGLDDINNAISAAKSAKSRSDLEEVQRHLDYAADAIAGNAYLPAPDEYDGVADRLADELSDVGLLDFQPDESESGKPEPWETYAEKLAAFGIERPETALSTYDWSEENYDLIRGKVVGIIAGWLRSDTASKKTEERGPPPFPGAVFDNTKHRWVKPDTDIEIPGTSSLADVPDEARQVVLTRTQKAILKAYGVMARLDSFAPKVQAAIEAIWDEPGDMLKAYYTPATGGSAKKYDAVANDLGISTNTLGIIMTKVIPIVVTKAWFKLKGKRKEAIGTGGIEEAADMLAELLETVFAELGFADPGELINRDALRDIIESKMGE